MAENKNLSCKKTYKLIQQTPIIHFQHDQSGATLRATEVKPKLDKFIIKKMGGKENVDKKWFISGTDALNYKMQIVATGKPEKSNTIDPAIEMNKLKLERKERGANSERSAREKELDKVLQNEINGMYFGNMVSDAVENYEQEVCKNYKETVFYNDKINDKINGKIKVEITLRIICLIDELSNYIEQNIEEFFLTHNFGTRQSKGFGGFSLELQENSSAIETPRKQKNPIEILKENNYEFFYAEVKNSNYKDMLNHAKNIYAILKGGYNLTGWDEKLQRYKNEDRYIKGYIQKQFFEDINKKDVGSDKAFIKSKKYLVKGYIYPTVRKGKQSEYKYDEYLFSRALLGLADHYEFRDTSRKGNVEIFSLGDNNFDVERFKSPVTIKIVNNYIIFIFGDFSGICNKTFYFSPNGYKEKEYKDLKTYSDKKQFIETAKNFKGENSFVGITTPDKVNVSKLILDFVNYFEESKPKLKNFNGSVKETAELKLVSITNQKGEVK